MTTIKVPYLATVWAVGSFDYNQHTAKSAARRGYLMRNQHLGGKRCFKPAPFYAERSFEVDIPTMEKNYVIFEILEHGYTSEDDNGIENGLDIGKYMLDEDGIFYQVVSADTMSKVAILETNDIFRHHQTAVCDDSEHFNRYIVDLDKNIARYHTGFRAGVEDLSSNAIIVDDEDKTLLKLIDIANQNRFHNGEFWCRMPDYNNDFFLDKILSTFVTDGFEPVFFRAKTEQDNPKDDGYMDHQTKHLRFMSVWELRNREDFSIRILDGDSALLDFAEHRNMTHWMHRNPDDKIDNPIQANKKIQQRLQMRAM